MPVAILLAPPDQLRRDDVMTASEYICPDLDNIACKPLDRKSAGVHAGIYVLNVEAACRCTPFACP
jgi:hypothetical protein